MRTLLESKEQTIDTLQAQNTTMIDALKKNSENTAIDIGWRLEHITNAFAAITLNAMQLATIRPSHARSQEHVLDCGRLIDDILNYSSSIVHKTTGEAANMSVKLLRLTNKNGVEFFTFKRYSSNKRRSMIDREPDNSLKMHSIFANSCLQDVFVTRNGKDFYLSNDLQNDRSYTNSHNPNWREFYNACIVTPIVGPRISVSSNLWGKDYGSGNFILGFLCADNMVGGFTEYELVILRQMSVYLFALIHIYYGVRENMYYPGEGDGYEQQS